LRRPLLLDQTAEGGETNRATAYTHVDPIGTIADMAGVGAAIGAAISLGRQDDGLPDYVAWGLVAGGALGVCRALIEGLWL